MVVRAGGIGPEARKSRGGSEKVKRCLVSSLVLVSGLVLTRIAFFAVFSPARYVANAIAVIYALCHYANKNSHP